MSACVGEWVSECVCRGVDDRLWHIMLQNLSIML